LLIIVFAVFGWGVGVVRAQTATGSGELNEEGLATMGVARMVEIQEADVKDGSILSASVKGYVLSTLPYDPQVMGVVARDAAIIINFTGIPNSVPVISEGIVYMLVSPKDGQIKKGDLLTTSTIPGVGVKANKPGYVLGVAKENSEVTDPNQIDKIAVDLNLHYFSSKSPFPGSLTDILKIALFPTKEGPTPWFKYLIAALVVLLSILLGFLTFGRTAAKGVEALGRNPAASRLIYLGIIFNVTLVVVIVGAGLVIGFLILRL